LVMTIPDGSSYSKRGISVQNFADVALGTLSLCCPASTSLTGDCICPDGRIRFGASCTVNGACTPQEKAAFSACLVPGWSPSEIQACLAAVNSTGPACQAAASSLFSCAVQSLCWTDIATMDLCLQSRCKSQYEAAFAGIVQCADGETRSCGSATGACRQGIETCSWGLWSGTCSGAVLPIPEICGNGVDDDCDGVIDFPNLGQTCNGTGVYICSPDGRGTVCSVAACTSGTPCNSGLPGVCSAGTYDAGCYCYPNVKDQPETCNGLDDDCDGRVDEDFPNLGQICNGTGVYVCSADGRGTVCSVAPPACTVGSPCSTGQPGVCSAGTHDAACVCVQNVSATAETCNGIDDDCNGTVDRDAFPDLGQTCNGTGVYVCSADGRGTVCSVAPPACTPGSPCSTGQPGICSAGTYDAACSCVQNVSASTEICNGIDDDCNGTVDRDAFPNLGQTCNGTGMYICSSDGLGTVCSVAPPSCTPGGSCSTGEYGVCSAGTYDASCNCLQTVQPATEICGNGLDDDCNNIVDDPAVCDVPSSCLALKTANPSVASGLYSIRPTSGLPPIQAYCDMVSDGGGWTLVSSIGHTVSPRGGASFPNRPTSTYASMDTRNYSALYATAVSFKAVPSNQNPGATFYASKSDIQGKANCQSLGGQPPETLSYGNLGWGWGGLCNHNISLPGNPTTESLLVFSASNSTYFLTQTGPQIWRSGGPAGPYLMGQSAPGFVNYVEMYIR
ncbi:MAG TPA: MopE-related protein, partial [Geobacteraceae bacterium]